MIREFSTGVRLLLRGFGLWRTRPGLMALGLIPAVISVIVLAAVLVPLVLGTGSISTWITPFADGWIEPWRGLLRGAVSLVIIAAGLALAGALFTALTLTIGDPFYQRIWHAVERDLGDAPPADGGSFWTTVGEGLRLVLLGLLIAILVLVLGLVPLIGGFLGPVAGIALSGRMLARELTGRAFDARDLNPADRAALFGGSRARVLGFGVATQLCFLIPGGAVAVMPAAVAGATMLARTMTERTTAARAMSPAPGTSTGSGTHIPSPSTGSGTHIPAPAPFVELRTPGSGTHIPSPPLPPPPPPATGSR